MTSLPKRWLDARRCCLCELHWKNPETPVLRGTMNPENWTRKYGRVSYLILGRVMEKKRQVHSVVFKEKVALAALREKESVA